VRPLRIALVLAEPPAPRGHPSARWFHVLLEGLAARGHRVTAFAPCADAEEMARAQARYPAPLDLRCYLHPRRGRLRSKWETLRRPFAYTFSDALRAGLAARLAQGVDVLHLEQLTSGWLGLERAGPTLLMVHHLYAVDLADARGGSLAERAERRLLRATERRLLRRYPEVATVSPRLADEVRRLEPGARVHPVPLTIDLEHHPRLPARATEPVVSLVGNMGWGPSRAAAERLLGRLWPRIQAEVPEARLEVVGWSARRVLAEYVDLPGVTIAEDVPRIEPYLERAALLLYAPGRGSGVKVKVLEALASGVPVVTNREGAEGLEGVEDGVNLGLADDDAGLVARAVTLLRDPARRDAQRAQGRALIERRTPAAAIERLEQVYALLGVGR